MHQCRQLYFKRFQFRQFHHQIINCGFLGLFQDHYFIIHCNLYACYYNCVWDNPSLQSKTSCPLCAQCAYNIVCNYIPVKAFVLFRRNKCLYDSAVCLHFQSNNYVTTTWLCGCLVMLP